MSRTGLLGTDAGGRLVLRRVRVRVVSGDDAGREAVLEGGTLSVGTHPDAELALRDPTVAAAANRGDHRRHPSENQGVALRASAARSGPRVV